MTVNTPRNCPTERADRTVAHPVREKISIERRVLAGAPEEAGAGAIEICKADKIKEQSMKVGFAVPVDEGMETLGFLLIRSVLMILMKFIRMNRVGHSSSLFSHTVDML